MIMKKVYEIEKWKIKNSLFFIFACVLLLVSCKITPQQQVRFNVITEGNYNYDGYKKLQDKDGILLQLSFEVLKDSIWFAVDWNMFDKGFNYPKIIKDTPMKSLKKLLKTIPQSQIIIENNLKQFKYYKYEWHNKISRTGTFYKLSLHGLSHPQDFGFFKKGDIIGYNPWNNNRVIFPKYDLLINEQDSMLRFHFIYVPNEAEKQKGLRRCIYTSNWFKI